jgi:hypothetical protein
MFEDYVVEVFTPIETEAEEHFVYGWEFGYHQGEADGNSPTIQYWDGQDIWLHPDHTRLFAVFKGTLHFVTSWHPIHSSTLASEGEDREEMSVEEYPAVGDTLVLKVWPQDFIKLGVLLPEGAPIPKEIIYQNVDRDSVKERVRLLIRGTPGYAEDKLTDADLEELLKTWLEGQGSGILVNAGAEIGKAALVSDIPPRPNNITDVEIEHSAPEGIDAGTWARLTLKMIEDNHFYFSVCFLYYQVENPKDEAWVRPRRENDLFVSRCCNQIEELPVVRITSQVREGWQSGDEPDENMPPALLDVKLVLRHVDLAQSVLALADPVMDDLWRVQGRLYEGEHQWRFLGPQLYAECLPSLAFSQPRHLQPQTPPQPTLSLGVNPDKWLTFDLPDGRRERRGCTTRL